MAREIAKEITVNFQVLHQFCVRVVKALGADEEIARIVADILLAADLRGISSHGISRLPVYTKRIKLGLMDAGAMPVVVRENLCTALLDGNNGFGQVGAFKGMKACIRKAKEAGVGVVGVRNTNHIGMAAYYTMMAVKEQMVGMVFANASAHMPAWGGLKACLGTNPISIGIPGGKHDPLLLDMATSAAARGKIVMAARVGKSIPLGWAIDKEGNPTHDAEKALDGFILPLGGPKGYGLSLAADILAGVLTGSLFGSQIPSMTSDWTRPLNCGVWMLAFRVDNFMDTEEFGRRFDILISDVKDSPLAPGFQRIYVPGEIEEEKREEHLRSGIPLSEEVLCELKNVAATIGGVPLTF